MNELRVLLMPLASKLRRFKELDEILRGLKILVDGLYDSEYSPSSREEARRESREFDAVIALALTGGIEEMLLGIGEAGKPLIVVAHDQLNSLAASIEASSKLREMGNPSWIIGAWTPGARKRIESILRGIEAALRFSGMRIGLIGGISPWLVYSKSDPDSLKELFDIELVEVGRDELYSKFESSKVDRDLMDKVLREAKRVEVSEDDLGEALRVYQALKEIVEEHGLDALTIRCFDLIEDLGTTACLALSLLQDDGIVAGCEGDVPGLLSMILGRLLSGSPIFLANVSEVGDDYISLAHCTIALSMVDEYHLLTHFESGMGVGVSGRIYDGGRVTLLRFRPDLRKLRAIRGTILDGNPSKALACRTQFRIKVRGDPRRILEDPLGNHHVMALGDLVDAVKSFCMLKGIEAEIL